jgi:carbonic anhydrase/acetyltransferase-like protein (isoleucine patch superfamily)
MNKARFTAPNATILGDADIGEGTWIGFNVVIESVNAKVSIGKNCSIASGVHICSHSSHEEVSEGKPRLRGAVTIKDNVVIGSNSVVLYDTYIGERVVIPALTLIKPHTRIERNNV